MKKVIVVGCHLGPRERSEIIQRLREELHNANVNVIFYYKQEDIPIPERGLQIEQVHKFENRVASYGFEPKKKHMKKGHEKPYKFHR